ncbi:2-amino-4-hydroxy-6-hydroxymethyldihydropteridine diphosphokinase [Noviherbaspirillum denitrificans]|uniref:2-amino-4-hydroxy-6-hydroxymethyldihydropteridine pyrophosphokinase n=1 Tax=Noviherbaspirillum denitrificans TaxID=1968433 RepID=A0A254TKF1_9BURK|nr:2-amino-4-hydroxy-6-hydroxymethyldihydropteridine diphosphokinase [Noviherbaspirillum denitrificans]OWW21792.1 2-amino-4-hydroxy-6-hydroxymethyldihydropteridine pyrophosphokinase [Noviherbaspirillum denitrificans]
MTMCHIGIGANLGDARDTVRQAIERIGGLPHTRLAAQSSLFNTAPVDAGGDDYVNAVVKIETALEPEDLLQALRSIEQDFGRERPFRNAPRTLDLDILLYGDRVIGTDTLTVPHPRMTQRAFVLIPLLEVDPFITIPGHGPAHAFVPNVADQAIRKI